MIDLTVPGHKKATSSLSLLSKNVDSSPEPGSATSATTVIAQTQPLNSKVGRTGNDGSSSNVIASVSRALDRNAQSGSQKVATPLRSASADDAVGSSSIPKRPTSRFSASPPPSTVAFPRTSPTRMGPPIRRVVGLPPRPRLGLGISLPRPQGQDEPPAPDAYERPRPAPSVRF